jgi:hypothetical protein
MTRALAIEERLAVQFLDRTLWNGAILAEVSPLLAKDYLSTSLRSFLHDPAMYRDYYLAGVESAVQELSERCRNHPGTLERFADVVQLRARERGIDQEAAKTELLTELVTLHIASYTPLALKPGDVSPTAPLSEGGKAIKAIVAHYEKGAPLPAEQVPPALRSKIDAFLRLDVRPLPDDQSTFEAQAAILDFSRRDPHVRCWRHLNRKAQEFRAVQNGVAAWMPPAIRDFMKSVDAMEDVNNAMWKNLELSANTHTLSLVAHVERLREKRGEGEVTKLKHLMLRWMELTAQQITINPALEGRNPMDLRQDHFRGFRGYQEFGETFEAIRRNHPIVFPLYVLNTPAFAAFCGYDTRRR